MAQFIFDSGKLFGTPAGGSPIQFASLQEVTPQFDFRKVMPSTQFASPTGRALNVGLDMKFKAKSGQVNGLLMSSLFFGQALSAGSILLAKDVEVTVPATAPYEVTVTPPSGAYYRNLGAQLSAAGSPMALVAGTPNAGEYALAVTVYTFAAADAGKVVILNYLYTATTGNKITLPNAFKQPAPLFEMVLNGSYESKQMTWILGACTSRMLSLPMAIEKISIPDFEIDVLGDGDGNVGIFSYAE